MELQMKDNNIKDLLAKDSYVPVKPTDEWIKIESSIRSKDHSFMSFLTNKVFLGLVTTSLILFAVVPSISFNHSSNITNEELISYIYSDTYLQESDDLYEWIDKDL
jgi:hypothetical protein